MFDDDSTPHQKTTSEIDKVKAKISLAILSILFPAALEEMAAGTLAKITGMFSESTEGGALAGASSGGERSEQLTLVLVQRELLLSPKRSLLGGRQKRLWTVRLS